MKKRSYVILVVAVLLAILLARTLRFTSHQVAVAPVTPDPVDSAAAASRLAGALRFKTVSTQDPSAFRPEEFAGLRSYLEQQFPAVHAALARELVDGYSLLYTWKGQDPSLSPVLLMAHIDVVPAEPESAWEHPPFDGGIAGGFVWGRGALDDKGSAMALFEAVEALLKQGYRPRRTVYLAFGHNEEVLGSGAAATANLLKSRGVQLESVLDEGSAVVVGMVPEVPGPVALVGTAEKGYMSVRLMVEMEGGHSSMPPRHTAVGVLSKAIVELEKRRMPARFGPPVDQMFEYLGPELSLPGRLIFANLWLLGPLVRQVLAGSPPSNAMIRTTTAPTMVEGSSKENVLPAKATAVVNFRILPGDTTEEVLAHVRNTMRDDRVKVEVMSRSEASPVTPVPSADFDVIQKTIRQTFSGTLVAPSLVIGATDSRYYGVLTRNVFRFVPFRLQATDLERVHGSNERVGVEDYAHGIQFYAQYLRNATQ